MIYNSKSVSWYLGEKMWDVNKDLESEAIVNEWICYQ